MTVKRLQTRRGTPKGPQNIAMEIEDKYNFMCMHTNMYTHTQNGTTLILVICECLKLTWDKLLWVLNYLSNKMNKGRTKTHLKLIYRWTLWKKIIKERKTLKGLWRIFVAGILKKNVIPFVFFFFFKQVWEDITLNLIQTDLGMAVASPLHCLSDLGDNTFLEIVSSGAK